MHLMNNKIVYLLIFVLCSCQNPFESINGEIDDNVVFYTSFESESELADWTGDGYELWNEAPESGGNYSLYVSSGCTGEALYVLDTIRYDCTLEIQFWGKSLRGTGYLSVFDFYSINKTIFIEDSIWQFYGNIDSIHCPANSEPRLRIHAGAFFSDDAILIDEILVKKK